MASQAETSRALYAKLMTELRSRRLLVQHLLDAQFHQIPNRLIDYASYELCYLQLRMICELIALACLAAHGDIPSTKTKRLQKEYDAEKVLKALSELHPEFYPVPVEPVWNPPVSILAGQIKPIVVPYLTKKDLIRLYGECGNVLHRGSTKNLAPKTVFDFAELKTWHNKVFFLVKAHNIILRDPSKMLFVLINPDKSGLASVTLGNRLK